MKSSPCPFPASCPNSPYAGSWASVAQRAWLVQYVETVQETDPSGMA
jgi:hypothetical protein